MAIFASTTTSGYSDPMKAFQIKALEQRQKDMMAQQATQQAGMFTPENTQTPVQGLGQVANVFADKLNQRRADQDVAAGRNEFASVIAQGPKGPDGNWAPEQLAVMARRAPEQMAQFYKDQQDNRFQAKQIGSNEKINTETVTGQNQRNTADIAGRKDVATLQETGANVRQAAGDQTKTAIAAGEQSGLNTRQTAGFDNEARQARLNAELTQAQKDRDQAFSDKQTDKAQEHERKIVELKADLAGAESELGRKHEMNKLKEAFTNDSKLAELGGALRLEQIKLQVASTSTDNREAIASREKIEGLKAEQAARAAEVERAFKKEQQTQAENATSKDIAFKTASQEKIAASEAAAKAAAEVSDPKRAEAVANIGTKYVQQAQAAEKMGRALHILDNGGINTGPWAKYETAASNLTNGKFGGSKEMAQRTIDFNNIVNYNAIKQMSETLKGQSTDFEMTKFLEVLNNPSASPEERRTALQEAYNASIIARDLHADAVRKTGGNVDTINAHLKARGTGGDVATPPPGGGGGGGGTSEDAAALKWANDHPTDPRAAQIKSGLGK